MKKILRFVYARYKQTFYDLLVEDLLLDVPQRVTDTGLSLVAEKREQVIKWLYWQAHALSRRNPAEIGNADKRLGMLLQIKMWLVLIGQAPKGKEEHPVIGETLPPPEDWSKGVKAFKEKKLSPTK
jgi:hypothetical protein